MGDVRNIILLWSYNFTVHSLTTVILTESIVDLLLLASQEIAIVIIHFLFMSCLTLLVVVAHLYWTLKSLLDLVIHFVEHLIDGSFSVPFSLLHKCFRLFRGEAKRQDLGGDGVVRCHNVSKVDIPMAVLGAHDPMHMLIVLEKTAGPLHDFEGV